MKLKALLPLNLSRINQKNLLDFSANHLIHYSSPIILIYTWNFEFATLKRKVFYYKNKEKHK